MSYCYFSPVSAPLGPPPSWLQPDWKQRMGGKHRLHSPWREPRETVVLLSDALPPQHIHPYEISSPKWWFRKYAQSQQKWFRNLLEGPLLFSLTSSLHQLSYAASTSQHQQLLLSLTIAVFPWHWFYYSGVPCESYLPFHALVPLPLPESGLGLWCFNQ